MLAEKEEEDASPEEYVALCDFTASGSEQVILLPVKLVVKFSKTDNINNFLLPFVSPHS